MSKNIQIGLSIGNSRYHWAWFLGTKLQSSWDTAYLTTDRFQLSFPVDLQAIITSDQLKLDIIPIYLISVVSTQTVIWQQLAQVKLITLADIPLTNLYPTLGIDRAMAVFGGGEIYGYPVLVIDGGTALTITGIDRNQCLIGGAILPGLKLQLSALAAGTAALPAIELPQQLPPRWSKNTPESISSGILYTIRAGISDFIQDWHQLHPCSQIIFTGGDGALLAGYLARQITGQIIVDNDLVFYGLSKILT